MKKILKKSLAMLAALVLMLSSAVALPISAKSDQTSFVFEALTDAGGKSHPAAAPLTLQLDASGTVYKASGLSLLSGATNALYVSLYNNANATAIRVSYSYEVYAVSSTETVERPLQQKPGEKQSVVLPAPNIGGNVTAIEISFVTQGEASGAVVLQSFFNFSTYVPQESGDATFTTCHYISDEGVIQIAGDLSYAATVRYEGQTLALFALSAGEDLHLSSKTPIARTGVSFKFSFSVTVESADDLFSRYVVAAVTQNGERVPLCTPVYPSITQQTPNNSDAFKGFHTKNLSDVLDASPGTDFVDVYLDQLLPQVTPTDSVPYAGEHSYYYFSKSYLNQIDHLVQNLSGIGCEVYFRFLISPEANGRSFTDYSEADGRIINKLPALRSEEAQREVYAITAFLAERYASQNVGGIVLGRSADLASTHSFASCASLSEYSELYVCALNLIAGAARRYIPDLQIVVPISDRIWTEKIDAQSLAGTYPTRLFLDSLFAALEAHVLDPQSFGVMLESGETPDRVSGKQGENYGIDRIGQLMQLLQEYTAHSYFQSKFIYSWLPSQELSGSELKASYLLQYLTLFQNGRVRFFITDLSLLEKEGKSNAADALMHLVQYIDTNRFSEVSAPIFNTLGVATAGELFVGFDEKRLQQRRIHRANLQADAYESLVKPQGSYTIWDFTTATGTMNWYAGNACTDLSVLTDANSSRSLTAKLSGGERYGDIAYHFPNPVDLSFAPLMQIELAINGNAGARYEVQLRLVGEKETVLASAMMESGQREKLYFDLESSPELLSGLRCIRLVARPLDGGDEAFNLNLYTFTLESSALDDSELAKLVSAIQQTNNTQTPDEEEKADYAVPLVVTAVILLASGAFIALLAIKYKSKRNTEQQRNNTNRKGSS